MDRVDRIRLRVLQAAAEEARGFDRLIGALLELGEHTVNLQERRLLKEYGDVATPFAAKRKQVLDALVEPYIRQIRERML